jgi:tetratricopeptide (TPR) repeat protein
MRRRQFLGTFASLAVPGQSLADPSQSRRLGASDVESLQLHTARLRRLDDVLGGADTYRLYSAQADSTARLLADAQYSEPTGRRLRSLFGEQHQLAGWAAFDAGHHAQGHRHFMDSFHAARDANDPALAGNALAFVAYQETATNKNGTATAQASYETARATATPRVEALLLERMAFAHAAVGDARQADTALTQAREALQRADDRRDPDWVFWVDEQEIDIMAGRCWTELRRPLRAVPVLEDVLARFDDTHGRDKALYLTWLASSYLQAGEIEQAATTLLHAHDLSVGVGSVRPAARIATVARRLDHHRGVREVSHLLDRIRA